jgi:uncharacterized membrane protein YdjX (TVP38/TMEM64 family)
VTSNDQDRTCGPRRLFLPVLLAAALVLFLWLLPDEGLSIASLRGRRDLLADQFAANPWQTALAFCLLYVTCAVLLLPWAWLLSIAAGAVFGLAWGIPLGLASATLGALCAFVIARHLGRGLLQGRFGERLAAINHGIEREGAFHLFALRLVPFCPYVLINPLMGLTAMPLGTFVWVSALGMAPVMAVYVNAGTRLGEASSLGELLSPLVLASLALLGLFPLLAKHGLAAWRRRRRTNQSARGPVKTL